jgi:hypothetical protein
MSAPAIDGLTGRTSQHRGLLLRPSSRLLR